LTDSERRTVEACPNVHLVTIPGNLCRLPNEVPEPIAGVVLEATVQARRQSWSVSSRGLS
jgi:hypothetical protein